MFDIVRRAASLEISETTNPAERDRSVDFIKGILILLVVFGHSVQFIAHARTESFWDDGLFEAIYLFHMPAFIAVSGYLAARKIDATTSLHELVSRRMLPLLLAMIIWSTISAGPSLRRAFVGAQAHVATEIWDNFLTLYWFLWALVVSAGCAFLASRFEAGGRRATLAIAALLLLAPIETYPISIIRYTAPFYLAAYACGRSGLTIRSIRPEVAAGAAVFAAVGSLFWTRDTYIYNNALAYWRPEAAADVTLMLCVAAAATLAFLRAAVAAHDRFGDLAASHALAVIGGMTLEIYLAQTVVFRFLPLPPDFQSGYLVAAAATIAIVAGIMALVAVTRRLPGAQLLWGSYAPVAGRRSALPFFARSD
ncbi:acyltransferase family protein [Methylosinus sp. H3A]|uniref:acyltransferase family protein n=1 Tax=Methylosinus sp. H3A TaxID=2785786 RepID=UPI0018C289BA|nr:acyltransferase family protein [Methylosinus sp. H3A]MBG0811691.1 acyltransferase family protein [Methylosinus sp. H3A]